MRTNALRRNNVRELMMISIMGQTNFGWNIQELSNCSLMHHFFLRVSLDSITLIIYKIIVDDLIKDINVCLCICMSFYGVCFIWHL